MKKEITEYKFIQYYIILSNRSQFDSKHAKFLNSMIIYSIQHLFWMMNRTIESASQNHQV